MTRKLELLGRTFNRLTALAEASPKNGRRAYLCLCECGNETEVLVSNLVHGRSKSCGCLCKEKIQESRTTHGACAGDANPNSRRTWNSWVSMRVRCLNPTNPKYYRYGGRGITVDEAWVNSFEKFYADMGDRPKGLSLNRIDNDKGYSKENCEWATPTAQANNRGTSYLIEFAGRTQTCAEWAKDLGIRNGTLHYRLKSGWSAEKALTTPIGKSAVKRRRTLPVLCKAPLSYLRLIGPLSASWAAKANMLSPACRPLEPVNA